MYKLYYLFIRTITLLSIDSLFLCTFFAMYLPNSRGSDNRALSNGHWVSLPWTGGSHFVDGISHNVQLTSYKCDITMLNYVSLRDGCTSTKWPPAVIRRHIIPFCQQIRLDVFSVF